MKHCSTCFRSILTLSAICIAGTHLHAAPIVGSQVTGELYFGNDTPNWFGPVPTKGYKPPSGFLNSTGQTTVTIGASAIEFGYRDGASDATFINRFSIDFTQTQLIITDTMQGRSKNLEMVFTSEAFVGATLTERSDSFPNGGVTAILESNRAQAPHTGTINACMADGSVRTLAPTMSGKTWWAAVTPREGEVLGSDW